MKKALFLDRDGIINHLVNYHEDNFDPPRKIADIKLIDNIATLLRWVNDKRIIAVEVTNQPSVAKGWINQKTSDAVEKKIHGLLSKQGVYVDRVYICPHHPKGIIPELAVDCECRKPKPGLLFQAAKEFGINFTESVLIGDRDIDMDTGKAVGCKTILYLHDELGPVPRQKAKECIPNFKVTSHSEVIKILKDLWVA